MRGRILIAVTQLENNKIQLCVSDDGTGIDVRQLREVAVRDGLRTQGQLEATDDAEALRLVFASGLSTSTVVSQVSGRGLGMAIVEEKVDYLGGSVTVDTEMGKGTMFRITVPATLATARGILAQVSDWPFVMPVVSVDRVVRVRKGDVRMVENRETIQLEGRTVPLVYLHEVLDLPLKPQRNVSDYIQAVVAGSGDDRVAFAVDRIIGEQEVLVKTLGPQLVRVRNIAGGTIIGSGKVVPIINIADLLQSAAASARQGRRSDAAGSQRLGDEKGRARGRGLHHVADAAQERARGRGLLRQTHCRRRRRPDGSARRGLRPRHQRHRDAAHGRLRAHQQDPRRFAAVAHACDAGDRHGVAGAEGEGHRRRGQRLPHQEFVHARHPARDGAEPSVTPVSQRAVRLLIVDHSPAAREQLRRVFEPVADIDVVDDAGTAEKALRLVGESTPNLILVDCDLPKPGSFALVREMMRQYPVPVVMLTKVKDTAAEFESRALETGAVALVVWNMNDVRPRP